MAALDGTVTIENEMRPVLVNLIDNRQVLGYFHGWGKDWIGIIEDPFSGNMIFAKCRDIVFMDHDLYEQGVWAYIYQENLRLMEGAQSANV